MNIVRKRAEHLGEVDAPDEQVAIKRAAEFSVRKISKSEK
jgi:hypothetical protein